MHRRGFLVSLIGGVATVLGISRTQQTCRPISRDMTEVVYEGDAVQPIVKGNLLMAAEWRYQVNKTGGLCLGALCEE
jgi:hypothetical protein